jgi:hypothetical protein
MQNSILDSTGHAEFDTNHRWANAFLGMLKAIDHSPYEKWKCFLQCIEYGLHSEQHHGQTPVQYFEEAGRVLMHVDTAYQIPGFVVISGRGNQKLPPFKTFLDFAVFLNLTGYVRAKGGQVERKELLHASKFKRLRPDRVNWDTDSLSATVHAKDRKALDDALSGALRDAAQKAGDSKWQRMKSKLAFRRYNEKAVR